MAMFMNADDDTGNEMGEKKLQDIAKEPVSIKLVPSDWISE
jgi:hypothetical protein